MELYKIYPTNRYFSGTEKSLVHGLQKLDAGVKLSIDSSKNELASIPSINWLNQKAQLKNFNFNFIPFEKDFFTDEELVIFLKNKQIPISIKNRMNIHDVIIHWAPNLLALNESELKLVSNVLELMSSSKLPTDVGSLFERLTLLGYAKLKEINESRLTLLTNLSAMPISPNNEVIMLNFLIEEDISLKEKARKEKEEEARRELYYYNSQKSVFIQDYVPD